MDGDSSAKAMEQGANSAMKDQELTSGIHESTKQVVCLIVVDQPTGIVTDDSQARRW